MSQVIPFQDSDLEKRYTFIRFLLTKLPKRASGPKYDFEDEVGLRYYRLQKISEGAIKLEPGEGAAVTGPTSVGTSQATPVEVPLSRLIDQVNERFGTDFTQADELFFNQIREEAVGDEVLRQAATVNTIDNFRLVFERALEGLFIDRMEQNEGIFTRYMNDADFRQHVGAYLLRQVYDQIRAEPPAA